MKKLIFILSTLLFITGCEGEQNTAPPPAPVATAQDSIQVYEGNFISAGNAAVLKGSQFIYQVKMDSTANDLKNRLQDYKDQNGNIIPVTVKGKVTDNPLPSGYSQLIEIREVLEITGEKTNNTEVKK